MYFETRCPLYAECSFSAHDVPKSRHSLLHRIVCESHLLAYIHDVRFVYLTKILHLLKIDMLTINVGIPSKRMMSVSRRL